MRIQIRGSLPLDDGYGSSSARTVPNYYGYAGIYTSVDPHLHVIRIQILSSESKKLLLD